jgi:hypothetical protein
VTEELIDKEMQVHNLADIFSTTILADECQKGMCFATCYPLSIHLENNDIKTSIVMRKYKGNIHYCFPSEIQYSSNSGPLYLLVGTMMYGVSIIYLFL